jgi:hypothetical protein
MRLTDATEIKLLANGKFVAVHEGTRPAVLFHVNRGYVHKCGWQYEGYPVGLSADSEWYPDSPSDLIQTCRAYAVRFDNGFACTAGHSHRTDAEYYEEDEVEAYWKAGHSIPSNARYLDGRPVR